MPDYKYVVGRIFRSVDNMESDEYPEYLGRGRWVGEIRRAHVFKTREHAEKAVAALRCGGKIVAIHPQYFSELFSEDNYAD